MLVEEGGTLIDVKDAAAQIIVQCKGEDDSAPCREIAEIFSRVRKSHHHPYRFLTQNP